MASSSASTASLPPTGVQWPTTASGKQSTTATGKEIWRETVLGMLPAFEGVKAQDGTDAQATARRLADTIANERDWRHKYVDHLHQVASLVASSPEAAFGSAEAGLAALYDQFVYRGEDRKEVSVIDAVRAGVPKEAVGTATWAGTAQQGGAQDGSPGIKVPVYAVGGKTPEATILEGDAITAQAKAWSDYGCCEPSVHASVAEFLGKGPAAMSKSLKTRVFVLLGGTSALGPARPLLEAGATVAAVARKGAKLQALAEFAKGTPGTLLVPVAGGSSDGPAGLDVLKQAPEVAQWVQSVAEAHPGAVMTVMSLIYLDGELHVRASVASDAITQVLQEKLGPERVELAYLGSPSTAHAWPKEARDNALARWGSRSYFTAFAGATGLLGFQSNVAQTLVTPAFPSEGLPTDFAFHKGYVNFQGPNYALAKTLQLWRGILARRDGFVVSSNFAPASRTESMTHSATMSAALDGMQSIEPLVAMYQDTTAAFMAILLVADLSAAEDAKAAREAGKDTAAGTTPNPTDPATALAHPYDMYNYNSFHGGNWRCAYSMGSIGAATLVAGKVMPSKGIAGVANTK